MYKANTLIVWKHNDFIKKKKSSLFVKNDKTYLEICILINVFASSEFKRKTISV